MTRRVKRNLKLTSNESKTKKVTKRQDHCLKSAMIQDGCNFIHLEILITETFTITFNEKQPH